MKKVPYINRFTPQGTAEFGYAEENEVLDKDKVDCDSCWWVWKIIWQFPEACDTCDWRGWNHRNMKWEFSCSCWAQTAWADCFENAEIPYCECEEEDE